MKRVIIICAMLAVTPGYAQMKTVTCDKGELIYENTWAEPRLLKDWVMEGPGELTFDAGWMHMRSVDQQWHHVLWCPVDFPASFIAEWEVQNMNVEAGLLIVFFAAKGVNGEDIFDPRLPDRDGTFRFYIKDKINSYHISYYANNPKNRERERSHLRKNNMFTLLQTGETGIEKNSHAIHMVRLVKDEGHILFFIDDRKVIDWDDDGKENGPLYTSGKVGFRQMQWSHFRYRNFKVWQSKQWQTTTREE